MRGAAIGRARLRGVLAGGPSAASSLSTRLRSEASSLIEQEPLLRRLLYQQVTAHSRLDGMLANLLADVLASADLGSSELAALFLSLYSVAPDLLDTAAGDVEAVLRRDPATESGLDVVLNHKGFQAICAHRLASHLWRSERRALSRQLQARLSRATGIDIHPACQLGQAAMFDHGTGIVIGETCVIGDGVSLLQGVTLGGNGKDKGDRHPKLGHGVLVGAGATLLGNIEVGDGARIGAGSVVLENVPANATAVGVPARIVSRSGATPPPGEVMDHNILATGAPRMSAV